MLHIDLTSVSVQCATRGVVCAVVGVQGALAESAQQSQLTYSVEKLQMITDASYNNMRPNSSSVASMLQSAAAQELQSPFSQPDVATGAGRLMVVPPIPGGDFPGRDVLLARAIAAEKGVLSLGVSGSAIVRKSTKVNSGIIKHLAGVDVTAKAATKLAQHGQHGNAHQRKRRMHTYQKQEERDAVLPFLALCGAVDSVKQQFEKQNDKRDAASREDLSDALWPALRVLTDKAHELRKAFKKQQSQGRKQQQEAAKRQREQARQQRQQQQSVAAAAPAAAAAASAAAVAVSTAQIGAAAPVTPVRGAAAPGNSECDAAPNAPSKKQKTAPVVIIIDSDDDE